MVLSKSKYMPYEQCRLWGYLLQNNLRSAKRSVLGNEAKVGTLAHELAEAYLTNAPIGAITTKYSPTLVASVMETMKGLLKVRELVSDLVVTDEETDEELPFYEIEKAVTIPLPEVAEDFAITGRFDVFGYKELTFEDEDGDLVNAQHAVVIELKTSAVFNDKDDTEALLYAFLAYRETGLPVIFKRFNLRMSKCYEARYSKRYLKVLEECFINEFTNYLYVINDKNKPAFTPGSHCLHCPFIDQCEARAFNPQNLQDELRVLEWAQQLVAEKTNLLKAAGHEVLSREANKEEELKPGYKMLIPGANLNVGLKVSGFWQLQSRKNKKSDVIKALAERNLLDTYINSLDIKFDSEELNDQVEALGYRLKHSLRQTISISTAQEEEEEEFHEDAS